MRIAAIADVHGNLPALDAVLADIARRGADLVVNLGDHCSGPLLPLETAERLIPLALPTVGGNCDRQVADAPLEAMNASDRFAATLLGAPHVAWLRGLAPTLRLTDDVLLVHGTPESDLTYWLESLDDRGARQATEIEVRDRADGVYFSLALCGHTHNPRMIRLGDGRTIVNPGSVGLPAFGDETPSPHVIEAGSPHARYAIVERAGAEWHVALHAVAYDWEAMARLAHENGRDDWAIALRTGRTRQGG